MCNAAKFQAIDRAFNNDGATRVITHTLPGKGHSVLTLDFVDEDGHPTREALNEILAGGRASQSAASQRRTRTRSHRVCCKLLSHHRSQQRHSSRAVSTPNTNRNRRSSSRHNRHRRHNRSRNRNHNRNLLI